MIVEKDDVQFIAFLQGSYDFLRHHQIGAIANHNVDLAVGRGHLDAQSSRNFIAHAGIAILEGIPLGVASAPEFVQITGKAARSTDYNVFGTGDSVHDSDDFPLADGRSMAQVMNSFYFILQRSRKCY